MKGIRKDNIDDIRGKIIIRIVIDSDEVNNNGESLAPTMLRIVDGS